MNTRVPKELEGVAKEFWQSVAPVLIKAGILTFTDRWAFIALCNHVALHAKALEMGKGTIEINQLAKLCNTGFNAFALNPASRNKLGITFEETETDEFGY